MQGKKDNTKTCLKKEQQKQFSSSNLFFLTPCKFMDTIRSQDMSAMPKTKSNIVEGNIASQGENKNNEVYNNPILQSTKTSLAQVLLQYGVNDHLVGECLDYILKGDFQSASKLVSNKDRQIFIKQCVNLKRCLQNKNNSLYNLDCMKKELLSLLSSYTSDVENCVNLLLQDKLHEALEKVAIQSREQFLHKLNAHSYYETYIDNHRKQKNANLKFILQIFKQYDSKISDKQKSAIQEEFLNGKLSTIRKKLSIDNFIDFLKKIMKEDSILQIFEKCQKFWQSISEVYFYPTVNNNQFNDILLSLQFGSECKSKRINKFKNLSLKEKIDFIQLELKNVESMVSYEIDMKLKTVHEFLLRQTFFLKEKLFLENKNKVVQNVQICSKEQIMEQIKMRLSQTDNIFRLDSLKKKKQENELKIAEIIQKNENTETYFLIKLRIEQLKHIFLLLKSLKERNSKGIIEVQFPQQEIYFKEPLPAKQIYKKMAEIHGSKNILLEFEYQERTKIILNTEKVQELPKKINVMKSTKIIGKLGEQNFEFILSKSMKRQSLHHVIKEHLEQLKNISVKEHQFLITVVLEDGKSHQLGNNSLKDIQNVHHQKIHSLIIDFYVTIVIIYQGDDYRFWMKSSQSILNLKERIFKSMSLPIQFQKIVYKENWSDQPKQLHQQVFVSLPFQQFFIFQLQIQTNLFYFGFQKNYELEFEQFNKLSIQTDQDLQKMIQQTYFDDDYEEQFLKNLVKNIYSAMKRKLPFSFVTDKIKNIILNKTQNLIWTQNNFTDYFILYYVLYNAEKKLRIELMNILRTSLPLPLYFRSFDHINSPKDEWKLNRQLVWLLHEGISIASIGLHSEEEEKRKEQTGKSFLNNKLFYTDFQDKTTKHPISLGCPEIVLKSLGNVVPINIVDIPSDCPKEISQRIIENCNVVVIHSWRSKKETEDYIKKLSEDFDVQYFIPLIRDHPNRSETIAKVNQVAFENRQICQLHNTKEYQHQRKEEEIPFMHTLREKAWSVVEKALHDRSQRRNLLFRLFSSKFFDEFEEILRKLKKNFYQLGKVNQAYETLKDKRKEIVNKPEMKKEYELELERVLKEGIHEAFSEVITFLDKNSTNQDVLLLRLREVLKEYKNEEEKKFYKINHYKKKMEEAVNNEEEFLKLRDQAIHQLSKLPLLPKLEQKESIKEMMDEIRKVFQFYENEIRPKFFTIELVWRELQYLVTLKEDFMLEDKSLLEILVDLKRKQIESNQPFEFLDGDQLEMPKKILKKSFEGREERIVVITIFGPQSSGKSTLLNFLFGCDFGTSEGRCTKGMYGTFFKFQNPSSTGCDGIFLVDTQGLFANVTKKDAEKREDFDSKLVLFCLAISDIVIINTKGNLDNKSTQILESGWQRFEALTQQNVKWPQIFLVLNQNASGNMIANEEDSTKFFREKLNVGKNSFSLNFDYIKPEVSKKKMITISEMESFVKKQIRPQFLEMKNKFQKSLLDKIRQKKSFHKIETLIDQMEQVWIIIESLPNLVCNISIKHQKIELQLQQWKVSQMDIIDQKINQMFEKLKQKEMVPEQCHLILQTLLKEKLQEYEKQFVQCQNTLTNHYDAELINAVQFYKKNVQASFKLVQDEFKEKMKQFQNNQQIKKFKEQGIDTVLREIRKIRSESQRQYSIKQKEQVFQSAFKESLEKVSNLTLEQEQLENYFVRVREYYEIALSKQNKNAYTLGLIRDDWQRSSNQNLGQYAEKLKKNIIDHFTNSNQVIQFKEASIKTTEDVKENIYDKLEYFSMEKYFQKRKINKFILIPKDKVKKALNVKKMRQNLIQKSQHIFILQEIFSEINQSLSKKFGFKIQNFQWFMTQFSKKSQAIFITFIELSVSEKAKFSFVDNDKNILDFLNVQQTENSSYELNQNPYIRLDQISGYLAQRIAHYQTSYSLLRNQNYYIYLYNNLQSKINLYINWKEIEQKIKSNEGRKSFENRLNNQYHQKINNQLSNFGLKIQFESIYNVIDIFAPDYQIIQNETKKFSSMNDFETKLHHLSYFQDKIISNSFVLSNQNQYSYNFCLGLIQFEELKIKSEYNDVLSKYISDSPKDLFPNLKNKEFRDFIFNELQNSFILLLDKIKNIIINTKQTFSVSNVSTIFMNVKNELKSFNDDLSSVNHQLTILFMGQVHMYAIHLIWKKICETAVKQSRKPYNNLLKTKQQQLRYFMFQTSYDSVERLEGQSQIIYEQIMKGIKDKCQIKKQQIMNNQISNFKQTNTFKQVDEYCFNEALREQQQRDKKIQQKQGQNKLIDYLLNTRKVIQDRYDVLRQSSLSKIKNEFLKIEQPSKLVEQIKELLEVLLNKMQENNIVQNSSFTLVFANASDNDNIDVKDKMSMALGEYFFDLLLNKPKQSYKVQKQDQDEADQTFTINEKYRFKTDRNCSKELESIILRIKQRKIQLNHPYSFCKKLLQKFLSFDKKCSSLLFDIQNILSISQNQKNKFLNQTKMQICEQKCPGCGRICGLPSLHSNKHNCLTGHQIKAIGGTKFYNNNASLQRCPETEMNQYVFNKGKKLTWKELKSYSQLKSKDAWNFDDFTKDHHEYSEKQSQKNLTNYKQRLKKAWNLVGRQICKNYGFNFIQIKKSQNTGDLTSQHQTHQKQKIHYIFGIEKSQNMTSKWLSWNPLSISGKLNSSLQSTLNGLKNMEKDSNQIRVTIFIFNRVCKIIYENESPSKINLDDIIQQKNQSDCNLQVAFGTFYNLFTKHINDSFIQFVLMTGDVYDQPKKQIESINKLKCKYPLKIQFTLMKFDSSKKGDQKAQIILNKLEGTEKLKFDWSEFITKYNTEILP